jgi:crotonobetainyl-CoA:carnitine CoA-transferase CaiB-like acyl-CoA transferase/citrate lyase beta subunit
VTGQDEEPTARSWLFVPGDRPDRFAKAARSGADEVICDLEDSVPEAGKDQARRHVAQWLAQGGSAWVRVNACSTPHYERDIAALAGLAGLRGIVVPKAEAPAALAALGRRLPPGAGIVALVETAAGLLRAPAIARCPAVTRLAFGSIDFAADIDAAHDDEALLTARAALVIASRAAGKPAPVDGVTAVLDRPEAVAQDAARARRLGFGGKLCIHPAQVPAVTRAFCPSEAETAWAREITDAAAKLNGAGAGRSDGQMIDKPVIDRARRILDRAAAGPEPLPGPREATSALPLAGIVVVTLEQAVAAPFATRQLADLGARVIKVERPGSGDFARDYDRSVLGQASYFVWLNRGKESVELDVKSPDGQAALAALLAQADVFVQNLAPGAAERLGLGAGQLRARHPRLICCSVSGYGPDGPYQHKKAYDLLVQCEAGLLSVTGTPDEPSKAGISVADIAAGMYAYSGVLTALYERERTGRGSSFDVAMLDALGEWMSQPYYYTVYGERDVRRTGARHASISPYGPYSARGGQVFLGLQNDREWAVLCERVLRRPDLITDQRFRTNPDRVAHDAELTTIIETAIGAMTPDEVVAVLDEAGIACARLRTPAEYAAHPQLAARDRWREVDTPAGPVRALLPPVSVPGREAAMGAVPALGQHTASVLAEFQAGQDITGLTWEAGSVNTCPGRLSPPGRRTGRRSRR